MHTPSMRPAGRPASGRSLAGVLNRCRYRTTGTCGIRLRSRPFHVSLKRSKSSEVTARREEVRWGTPLDQVKAAKFEVSEGRESLRYKLETEAAHAESYPCTRVLLVEDNAINRLLAVRLLEKKGYHVTATAAGMEALAALERDCFQLVLTDVQMPNMDGFELTKTIREKEQATRIHLPIIAITAHAGKEDREACLQLPGWTGTSPSRSAPASCSR